MANMGVDTLKNTLTNPARTYLWEIIMPTVIGAADAGSAGDILRIRAQSTEKPGRSVGVIKVPYKQTAGIVFAGKNEYTHSWKCTFIEGEDRKVNETIRSWFQFINDDYDGVGNGDDMIKTDIWLHMLTTKGDVYEKIKLIGCFPTSLAEVALNYTGDEVIKQEVTFAYDRFEVVE